MNEPHDDLGDPPATETAAGPGPRLDAFALHAALEDKRERDGISKRTMAREMMLSSPSILTRLSKGFNVSADALIRMLLYLGDTDLRPYIDLDSYRDQVDPAVAASVDAAREGADE